MMTTKLRGKVISLSMVHCCWAPPSRCRWQCHQHPSTRPSDPIETCANEAFPILQLSQPQDDDITRCAVSAFGVQFLNFPSAGERERGQESCSQHIVQSQSKCRRPDAHAFKLLSVQSNGVRLCGIVQRNFLPFERQKRHYCLELHIVLRINKSRKWKREKRNSLFPRLLDNHYVLQFVLLLRRSAPSALAWLKADPIWGLLESVSSPPRAQLNRSHART